MTKFEKYEMYCKSLDVIPPENWERHLVRFFNWEHRADHIDYSTDWQSLIQFVRAYVLHMNMLKLTLEEKRQAIVVLADYFRFLRTRKDISYNPDQWMRSCWVQDCTLDLNIITEADFLEIVNHAQYVMNWHPCKVQSVFRTLFFGGLTRKEFNTLKRWHFKGVEDTGAITLNVMRSACKIKRKVRLDRETSDYIRQYFASESQELSRNAFNLEGHHTYWLLQKLNEVCNGRKLDYVAITKSVHYIKQFEPETKYPTLKEDLKERE